MLQRVKFWKRDEEGATAVEYGIMVALIAVVIITAVGLLGGALESTFEDACDAIEEVEGSSAECD